MINTVCSTWIGVKKKRTKRTFQVWQWCWSTWTRPCLSSREPCAASLTEHPNTCWENSFWWMITAPMVGIWLVQDGDTFMFNAVAHMHTFNKTPYHNPCIFGIRNCSAYSDFTNTVSSISSMECLCQPQQISLRKTQLYLWFECLISECCKLIIYEFLNHSLISKGKTVHTCV